MVERRVGEAGTSASKKRPDYNVIFLPVENKQKNNSRTYACINEYGNSQRPRITSYSHTRTRAHLQCVVPDYVLPQTTKSTKKKTHLLQVDCFLILSPLNMFSDSLFIIFPRNINLFS